MTPASPASGADATFRAFLEDGRFMIQRSRSTGRHHFYPRELDPETGAADLEWTPASGQGTVYSVTIVRKKPPEESYCIVLVDLAEGPRMMSRVVGMAAEDVRIGLPVRARIERLDDRPAIVFEAEHGS